MTHLPTKATMKKVTIILAAIFIVISVSGQVKGVDLDNAVEVKHDEELMNHSEEWIKGFEEDSIFFYMINRFPKPVDSKHLIKELDRVLKANDLDINKPDREDDLFPSQVKGLTDYSNLDHYVSIDEAKIDRTYFIGDEWAIGIVCNYKGQVLFLVKSQE